MADPDWHKPGFVAMRTIERDVFREKEDLNIQVLEELESAGSFQQKNGDEESKRLPESMTALQKGIDHVANIGRIGDDDVKVEPRFHGQKIVLWSIGNISSKPLAIAMSHEGQYDIATSSGWFPDNP